MTYDVTSPPSGPWRERGGWRARASQHGDTILRGYRSQYSGLVLGTLAGSAGYVHGRVTARKARNAQVEATEQPAEQPVRGRRRESRRQRRRRVRHVLRQHPAYRRTALTRRAARLAAVGGTLVGVYGLGSAMSDAVAAEQADDPETARGAAVDKARRMGRVSRGLEDTAKAIGLAGSYSLGRMMGETHDIRRASR